MEGFKPSTDFVSRVMKGVYACEAATAKHAGLPRGLIGSWPLRFTMSGCGIFFWVFFSPVVCL
jgi:hypothetical protein